MSQIGIEHLRSWIGRQDSGTEEVTSSLVAKFLATFDMKGETAKGAAAPLAIHLCLAHPAVPTAELGPDGHPARGGFLPPVPLPRRMWAGGELVISDDIRIGEAVTRRSTIRDVAMKEGRSGTLCFVTVDHEITSNGRLVMRERQDIVYRDAGRTPAPVPGADAAAPGMHRKTVAASAPFLFRYSALTFNGHRIHYDQPYVTGEEGYPGLIVHGPIQMTMLLQFAADLKGRRPANFSFRSLSPLFDIADFTLNAAEEGEELKLWTSYPDGPYAMEARARW